MAFERLLEAESELVGLLEARLSEERAKLREMRGEEEPESTTSG